MSELDASNMRYLEIVHLCLYIIRVTCSFFFFYEWFSWWITYRSINYFFILKEK